MKANPLYKYYEMSGAEQSFEQWLAKYKEVYVSKKREQPFEDWLKVIIQEQQKRSNTEVQKLQAAGEINTEALKIKKKVPAGWALLIIGVAFIGSLYLYKKYGSKK